MPLLGDVLPAPGEPATYVVERTETEGEPMWALRSALIVALILLPAGSFRADIFQVTKTADTDDGSCDYDCSLREAIGAANTNPGADDVPVPAGNYLLTFGQLVVSDDVSIAGAGQTTTIIDGNATDRVFDIEATSGVVEISGVTIQNGYAFFSGGGIAIRGGKLALTDSTVSNNATTYAGGGISTYSYYTNLTLTDSTVSDNSVFGGVTFGGGGIYNRGNLTLTNSTVSGNTASYGGGIRSRSLTLANTIVADNVVDNCFASAESLGYNLTDDTSCALAEPTDLVVADAMLGPLQDNGGPTETHALLAGSPAIDAGSPDCPPPTTDQRGVARPQGAACDIGAVEFVPEPRGSVMLVAGAAFLGLLYRRRR